MQSDSTIANEPPVDPDDELLVAYLDGELQTSDRNELEERLLSDSGLRQRLQALQSGWELLDSLPMPTVNEKLVESTLELVVADIKKLSPDTHVSTWTSWRTPIASVLLAVLCAAVGYGWVWFQRDQVAKQRLADLAIAENFYAYSEGSDFELMRQLAANPAWTSMISAATEFGQIRGNVSEAVSSIKLQDRAEKIAGLPVDTRSSVESRWDAFQRKDKLEQEELRRVADAVKAQPDAELLLNTMARYAAWVGWLPASIKDSIATKDQAERKRAIESAISYSLTKLSESSGSRVDEESAERIFGALQGMLQDRIDQNSALGNRPESLNMAMMLSDRILPGEDRPARLSVAELQSLEMYMSDELIDDLDLLSGYTPFLGRNPLQEEVTLHTWAQESATRMFRRNAESKTNIERYLEINEQEREVLEFSDPESIMRALSPRRGFGGRRGR